MKTDLELLIEHLEAELANLSESIYHCIEEWDFEGAKAFREPLFYTRRKLNVLKCLKNPHYKNMASLSNRVSYMEKNIGDLGFGFFGLEGPAKKKMVQYFAKSNRRRLKQVRKQLAELEAIVPKPHIDDHKIMDLLESLQANGLSQLEFEVKKDKVYLLLKVSEGVGVLSIEVRENRSVDRFINQQVKSLIRRLGFEGPGYRKRYPAFEGLDKLKLLEDLAIIYFEVFGIFGEEREIRIE